MIIVPRRRSTDIVGQETSEQQQINLAFTVLLSCPLCMFFMQPCFLKECAIYKGKEVEENGQQRRLLPDQTTGRRRKATAPVMIWLLLMVPK